MSVATYTVGVTFFPTCDIIWELMDYRWIAVHRPFPLLPSLPIERNTLPSAWD